MSQLVDSSGMPGLFYFVTLKALLLLFGSPLEIQSRYPKPKIVSEQGESNYLKLSEIADFRDAGFHSFFTRINLI
jgi:hypothetical protein